MKRNIGMAVGVACLVLLLAGGAFMAGRLLGAGPEDGVGSRLTVQVSTADGQIVEAEYVRAEGLPDGYPDVAGAFVRMQDNSIFVDETEGGFVIAKRDDGSFGVANATGKISEVIVTNDTVVCADVTYNIVDEALSDGKLYQKVQPGSVEEIGDLSFVRAWGERRGDRLIADVLLYTPPPVIQR